MYAWVNAYARVRARAKCLHVSFLFIDAFRTALALIFLHFIYTATIISTVLLANAPFPKVALGRQMLIILLSHHLKIINTWNSIEKEVTLSLAKEQATCL